MAAPGAGTSSAAQEHDAAEEEAEQRFQSYLLVSDLFNSDGSCSLHYYKNDILYFPVDSDCIFSVKIEDSPAKDALVKP